jgi:gliding motility-associated-like protein
MFLKRTYRIALLTFILLLKVLFLRAQQEQNNWWYFNTAAVDFNSGAPVSVSGSAMSTSEGSASIADRFTGDLLFYTNGITIWNRLNQPMPNGTGLLGGTPLLTSSTTAALIVPRPANPFQYYVFTVDEQFGSNGLRWNLVDMTLNGGLGDVVAGQKNVLLSGSNVAEKLACAPNASLTGYWLISRETSGNQYFSWEITSAGINTTPVVSTAGTSTFNGAGYLKFNSDFTRLANAIVFGFVDVMNFNRVNGQVTSSVSLTVPIGSSVYGVEFSPSGRFLYVSNLLDGLFQFDLNAANVAASRQTVASTFAAALQLGPDCKIYVADGGLSVIPFPDLLSPACGFTPSAVNLSGNGSVYGLPMKVIYVDATLPDINLLSSDLCAGDLIQFSLINSTAISSSQTINWDFGDPSSGALNFASGNSAQIQSHVFSSPGQYNVKAIYDIDCRKDTVDFNVSIVNCISGSNACKDFTFTGVVQQWTVPSGVDTLRVKMWGAAGGGGPDPTNNAGGGGGFTDVTIPVVTGQVLDIYVGGGGVVGLNGTGGNGGWPNGGNGGSGNRIENGLSVGGAGGGGGRSEIRINGVTYAIAGGGGGGAYNRSGGGGGGLNAEFTPANNQFNLNGFGGTQTAGGAPSSNTICSHPVFGTAGASLQGGTGATDLGGGQNDRTGGGGGGDGYFGGGGGGSHDGCFGVGSTGGGGSGYICTSCPGVSGFTVTAGFFGVPANASDPLLTAFPSIGVGAFNTPGGNGLVYICFDSCASTSSSLAISSCNSYVSPAGNLYTIPGVYFFKDTLLNATGCDSIISINLTILPAIIVPATNVSACNSYTASWGTTYTTSGTYSDTLTTINGCDSIVSINLTINSLVTGPVQNVSACKSYTAPWGAIYTQSGTYRDTVLSSTGCDSVNIINLTINPDFVLPVQNVSACSTFTASWGTIYTTSGIYSNTYVASNGCDSIVSINLTINPNPVLTISSSPDSCLASKGTAAVTISGLSAGVSYQWSNGSISPSAANLSAGTYTVTVTNSNGCTSVVSTTVSPISPPVINLSPSFAAVIAGESVAVQASGALSYQWSPATGVNCDTCSTVIVSPQQSTNYVVTGTDANGCTATTVLSIDYDFNCNELFVPTIFSPNNEGPAANNRLCILSNCIETFDFAIYNRWGQLVYQTNDAAVCWDGTFNGNDALTGVYTYRLLVKQFDGKIISKSGNITLVR